MAKKINTSPTKTFFIETIVKDIHLSDAILDLIDNSIDSYIKSHTKSKKRILLNFSDISFRIEDDCAGIRKNETYQKVFRFGLPTNIKEKTIGVYGIGLKRAIFKIGRDILIESDDGKNFFSVRIDKHWLNNENDWDLDFENEEKSKGKQMTKITIKNLYPHIAEEMNNTKFQNDLINRISRTYSVFINRGLIIRVNGMIVKPYNFIFLFDRKKCFVPLHRKYKRGDVEIELYAGFTKIKEDHAFGWNIFCNDRLVVQNDVSDKTGWQGKGRKYHYPEDNRFLGLAFFRSDFPLSLPWHTTKEDIQYDSKLYRNVQVDMRAATDSFIDVIRLAGKTRDPKSGTTIGKSLFEGVGTKSLKEIKKQSRPVFPKIKGMEASQMPDVSSIQYTKDTKLIKKVKRSLGNVNMSNTKVGEATFDYYVEVEEV